MNCSSCGAPLVGGSNRCRYCETLNESDLRTLRRGAETVGPSARSCPRCPGRTLVELRVAGLGGLVVDRCRECRGIFFDPGELEQVLRQTSAGPPPVDRGELERLIAEEPRFEKRVAYLHCPVCRGWMTRRNFGKKSGIIVDRCNDHGVWLDGGELGGLVKWARAGGPEHDRVEREREATAQAERERAARITRVRTTAEAEPHGSVGGDDLFDLGNLLMFVTRVLRWKG